MSDAPKKRPLFQFHLSTAIVLMFVASGLLWPNVSTRFRRLEPSKASRLCYEVESLVRGWPFLAEQKMVIPYPQSESRSGPADRAYIKMKVEAGAYRAAGVHPDGRVLYYGGPPIWEFYKPAVYLYDLAAAIAILLGVGVLLEYLIRRKERRQ